MNSPFINLFNTKTQKHIANAPIKHQASINYFYDKDGFYEDNLKIIEDASAKSISKISSSHKKPSKEVYILIRK